jgi:predicted ester cyclase
MVEILRDNGRSEAGAVYGALDMPWATLPHLSREHRYVAAVNAHDTSAFPTIFTDGYIQHSGRSASSLAAQIGNFQRILELWPDIQMHIEDRIIADDKIVARVTLTATHSRTVLNVAPTGRKISFGTIDIWRVQDGKLAEHWDLVDTVGLQKQLHGE